MDTYEKQYVNYHGTVSLVNRQLQRDNYTYNLEEFDDLIDYIKDKLEYLLDSINPKLSKYNYEIKYSLEDIEDDDSRHIGQELHIKIINTDYNGIAYIPGANIFIANCFNSNSIYLIDTVHIYLNNTIIGELK